jgi:hypothetical protein
MPQDIDPKLPSLKSKERTSHTRTCAPRGHAGDTVLIPHEALSDTPAFLTVQRLMRRFQCTAREAAGLAELFIALDARHDLVAHYEVEARRRSVTVVVEDLVHMVAQLGAQAT